MMPCRKCNDRLTYACGDHFLWCDWCDASANAQAIEAGTVKTAGLDGEATKARSEGCAQGDGA